MGLHKNFILFLFCFKIHTRSKLQSVLILYLEYTCFPGGSGGKVPLWWYCAICSHHLPTNAGNARDTGSILGLGRSPGGGHGNPLQYSCLENPMDRGAWRATVCKVAQNWTWLKRLSTAANTLDPLKSGRSEGRDWEVLRETGGLG